MGKNARTLRWAGLRPDSPCPVPPALLDPIGFNDRTAAHTYRDPYKPGRLMKCKAAALPFRRHGDTAGDVDAALRRKVLDVDVPH